jgi:hypothetical protein
MNSRKNLVKILKTPIEGLQFSTREYHVLKNHHVHTIGDLTLLTEADLYEMGGMGVRSVAGIRAALSGIGLALNTQDGVTGRVVKGLTCDQCRGKWSPKTAQQEFQELRDQTIFLEIVLAECRDFRSRRLQSLLASIEREEEFSRNALSELKRAKKTIRDLLDSIEPNKE